MFSHYYSSPVGLIHLTGDELGIATLFFVEEQRKKIKEAENAFASEVLTTCLQQLDDYFNGARTEFSVKLNPEGTPFQKQVWTALCGIPFGETTSYGEIARRLGLPVTASRAIGTTNGRNPIAIIVPCHRVIGANGKLVGYAGGLWRKQWLLEFESPAAQRELF